MEIKQKLIPKSNKTARPGLKLNPEYITIHETDNPKSGADADAHARLQFNGNVRVASWHYSVDDKEIWQSLPDNEVGWACGDGRNGTGNRKSISIEICVNADGNLSKAAENAAWLVNYLMKKHGIPLSKVVQHNKWSGKNCPRNIRAQGWDKFLSLVKGSESTVASKTVANMYDLSYMKDYKLLGIRSSQHTDEICEKVADYMEANANCVLLLKRGFDLRALQKTLNDMLGEDK